MLVYVTEEEVLEDINFDREDLSFESETAWTNYLETVESRARSIINNIKDMSFEKESPTEITSAPESSTLKLKYPVQEVTQLRYRVSKRDSWKEVDSDNYVVKKWGIQLSSNVSYPKNPPYYENRKSSWQGFKPDFPPLRGTLEVQYDRGWDAPSWDGSGTDNIPQFLKSATLRIINNILIAKKTNQISTIQNIENPEIMEQLKTVVLEEVHSQIEDQIPDKYGRGGVI